MDVYRTLKISIHKNLTQTSSCKVCNVCYHRQVMVMYIVVTGEEVQHKRGSKSVKTEH